MKNFLTLCLFPLLLATTVSAERESYVVYLGSHRHELNDAATHTEAVTNSHTELLGTVLHGKENATDSIFYSYTNAINGFAAMLEEEEASQVSKHPDVVSVIRDKGYHLATTHSWEFLGQESEEQVLPYSLWQKANLGEDMIIANLDSGVAPEAESFRDDTGYGAIPERWKGICQNQTDANGTRCNRKLIGARFFAKACGKHPDGSPVYETPRDFMGHGTQTLSVAGGNMVSNVSYHGYAGGTIKGGAPRARVAAYKVCGNCACRTTDILAAFDAAIGDGVDVLSISLGGHNDYDDALSVGAFHAVSKGIGVVFSAGNDGPEAGTVSNFAPWQLTVGASIMDRSFSVNVLLGNNKTLKGQGLYHPLLPKKLYPLVSPIRTEDDCWKPVADPKVKGKIVICLGENGDGSLIQTAGGVGMILVSPRGRGYSTLPPQPLPTVQLIGVDGQEFLAYMNSTKSPVAYIGKPTTVLPSKPAPMVASFSSRGPNAITPEILKPDVIAPGVGILTASAVIEDRDEKLKLTYGTSIACPHVAGIVALLKKVHPHWSPAAINSAIMTTATQRDNVNQGIKVGYEERGATPFDYGAGHVVPNKAVDPGLIYDLGTEDYLNFFCAVGYNTSRVSKISGRPFTCPSNPSPRVSDLNYPSIGMVNIVHSATTSRTLKNVGTPGIYTVSIRSPDGFNVTVTPTSLKFRAVGEEKKFTITVTSKKSGKTKSHYQFGWLVWSHGVHHVRSTLFVKAL